MHGVVHHGLPAAQPALPQPEALAGALVRLEGTSSANDAAAAPAQPESGIPVKEGQAGALQAAVEGSRAQGPEQEHAGNDAEAVALLSGGAVLPRASGEPAAAPDKAEDWDDAWGSQVWAATQAAAGGDRPSVGGFGGPAASTVEQQSDDEDDGPGLTQPVAAEDNRGAGAGWDAPAAAAGSPVLPFVYPDPPPPPPPPPPPLPPAAPAAAGRAEEKAESDRMLTASATASIALAERAGGPGNPTALVGLSDEATADCQSHEHSEPPLEPPEPLAEPPWARVIRAASGVPLERLWFEVSGHTGRLHLYRGSVPLALLRPRAASELVRLQLSQAQPQPRPQPRPKAAQEPEQRRVPSDGSGADADGAQSAAPSGQGFPPLGAAVTADQPPAPALGAAGAAAEPLFVSLGSLRPDEIDAAVAATSAAASSGCDAARSEAAAGAIASFLREWDQLRPLNQKRLIAAGAPLQAPLAPALESLDGATLRDITAGGARMRPRLHALTRTSTHAYPRRTARGGYSAPPALLPSALSTCPSLPCHASDSEKKYLFSHLSLSLSLCLL